MIVIIIRFSLLLLFFSKSVATCDFCSLVLIFFVVELIQRNVGNSF